MPRLRQPPAPVESLGQTLKRWAYNTIDFLTYYLVLHMLTSVNGFQTVMGALVALIVISVSVTNWGDTCGHPLDVWLLVLGSLYLFTLASSVWLIYFSDSFRHRILSDARYPYRSRGSCLKLLVEL